MLQNREDDKKPGESEYIPCWMFNEDDESRVVLHKTTNHLSFANETVVKRVYNLIDIVDKALTQSGIFYWTSGGTLLGCIRHQGLIPWDDDLDLCIYKKDEEKINQCLERLLNDYGCEIVKVATFGYRIFHRTNSDKLMGHVDHRYPFCDIFVMRRRALISDLRCGAARVLWPEEWYDNKDIDNIQTRLFGDIYLNCPANADRYLKRNYGEKWYTEGSTHNYDHITKQYVNAVKFKLEPEHYEPARPFS